MRFVDQELQSSAYEDRALPIGHGQTISQPSMIALMLDALKCRPTDRALEVGAGCGYAAALLACLVSHVDAVEIRSELAARAMATLTRLGFDNVTVHQGRRLQRTSGARPVRCHSGLCSARGSSCSSADTTCPWWAYCRARWRPFPPNP